MMASAAAPGEPTVWGPSPELPAATVLTIPWTVTALLTACDRGSRPSEPLAVPMLIDMMCTSWATHHSMPSMICAVVPDPSELNTLAM